jgi:hypothetical protein
MRRYGSFLNLKQGKAAGWLALSVKGHQTALVSALLVHSGFTRYPFISEVDGKIKFFAKHFLQQPHLEEENWVTF